MKYPLSHTPRTSGVNSCDWWWASARHLHINSSPYPYLGKTSSGKYFIAYSGKMIISAETSIPLPHTTFEEAVEAYIALELLLGNLK